MFQEQNYENALTLNILWLNISCDIDINGFGRNSVRDMGTFRNCDVERFEIQTGDIKTPLKGPLYQLELSVWFIYTSN